VATASARLPAARSQPLRLGYKSSTDSAQPGRASMFPGRPDPPPKTPNVIGIHHPSGWGREALSTSLGSRPTGDPTTPKGATSSPHDYGAKLVRSESPFLNFIGGGRYDGMRRRPMGPSDGVNPGLLPRASRPSFASIPKQALSMSRGPVRAHSKASNEPTGLGKTLRTTSASNTITVDSHKRFSIDAAI